MKKNTLTACAVAFAVAGLTNPAAAADSPELAEIRAQIAQMKAQYEARIEALEKRLVAASSSAAAPAAEADAGGRATARASGFNPEISLILNGQWRRARDIAEPGIGGFWPASGHDHGGDARGLTLDKSELVLSANVDPNFRGMLNLAFSDGEAAVEEAWFQTLGLGRGLTLKGGRFLSSIGYINEQHPHAWDFADAPLTIKALFGEHYAQDGVQLKWLAPTDLFLELGAEIGRGAAFPGTDRNLNGAGAGALFAHLGGDVGAAHSWRGGLSYLATRAADRAAHFEDTDAAGPNEVEGVFTGKSRTWLADFVWKWAPDGNPRLRSLTFQTEFFRRNETGTLGCTADPAVLPASGCVGDPVGDYRSRQSGFYAQGVYRFAPAWRVGYRFDRLNSGRLAAGLVDTGVLAAAGPLAAYHPQRHTLMMDWSPSEFSRLRLQYARDRTLPGITDNQLILQYVMSLGAHGAHKY